MLNAIAVSARDAAVRLQRPGARYHLETPVPWRLTAPGTATAAREGVMEKVVLVLHDLDPATDWRLEVAGFPPLTFRTRDCGGLFRPSGLVADEEHAAAGNARILAEAVAKLPENGTIELGKGRFFSMPLALRSMMVFRLAEGSQLLAPSSRLGWPILPARDAAGHMLGSWEGLPEACFAAPVHAIGARELTIAGPGLLDGGGDRGDWWTWPKGTRDGARRPRGLHLVNCEAVLLLGFSIRNAPSWTIHPQGCSRLTAVGLHIMAPHDSPNTDGFDPEMCEDVLLEGIRFSVGDDCIAIKAGKRGPDGNDDHLRPTRGVVVRHCLMERGHGGVVIGSEMSGGVENVTVEACEMVGTDRGLRLKTRRGRGGFVRNIVFHNVAMRDVETAISANAFYHCDADGRDDWVQSRRTATVGAGTPHIRGIEIRDVAISGLSHAAAVFLGLPEAPLAEIRIDNLHVESFREEAIPIPPVMAEHIRPMRHEGVLAENADVTLGHVVGVEMSPLSITAAPLAERSTEPS